jgi:hypothetical protein
MNPVPYDTIESVGGTRRRRTPKIIETTDKKRIADEVFCIL